MPTATPAASAPEPPAATSVAYIVTFAPWSTLELRAAAIAQAGGIAGGAIPALSMQTVSFAADNGVAEVGSLIADSIIARVEADATRDAGAVPSDTDYPSQ